MGISERREREKDDRRRAILNSARELILLQGVERVSMEDIARKAELSKATVYLYFPGKEFIFNEICEGAARVFVENFKPLTEGVPGIKVLKLFWHAYMEQFGNADEMVIMFQVRNFLDSWLPIVSLEGKHESPYVDIILEVMRGIIDQCKAEGVFDPRLDSDLATRLLLSIFSATVGNIARIPLEARKSPAIISEMTSIFQIIIYGFAKEGVDRSSLDIMAA
jgi:AcrR family transcriptional regulator